MDRAKVAMAGTACVCKYRNIASDFQRPTSLIVSVSTRAHRRAVAPPGRRERAVSLEGSRPVES